MPRFIPKLTISSVLLLLMLTPLAVHAQTSVQVGDEVLVMVLRLPVHTGPETSTTIVGDVIKGLKSYVLAEQTDVNGDRWLYLEDYAYGWVQEQYFDQVALVPFNNEALDAIVADATAAVEAFNLNTEAWMALGAAHISEGDFDAAIAAYDQAIDGMRDGWLYEYRGDAYLAAGDSLSAINDFGQAKKWGRELPSTLNRMGIAYQDRESYEQALTYFDRAIELSPDYGLLYNNRAISVSRLESDTAALPWYEQALALDPYLSLAYANRGEVKRRLGDYEGALADFHAGLNINPYCSSCYRLRGILYNTAFGDYNAAIADLEMARQFEPFRASIYVDRGISYSLLGNHEQAISDYHYALELDPNFEIAQYNLGFEYARLGEYQKAIEAYSSVTELYGDMVFFRAQVYIALENYEAALRDITFFIDCCEPSNESERYRLTAAYIILGDLHLQQNAYQEAITAYQLAFNTHRDFALNYAIVGSGYQVTPMRLQTLAATLGQINSDPNNVDLYLKAANLYMEFGFWQDGLGLYEQYLQKTNNPVSGLQIFVNNMQALINM